MNQECYDWVRLTVAELPPRKRVVEFGSLNVNGTVRDLFPGIPYLGIDLVGGPSVDVVADAEFYTPEDTPDTVICLSVLEHTPRGEQIIQNAWRILAPGGVLLLAGPTDEFVIHSADGGPLKRGEYYKALDAELLVWARKFESAHLFPGEGMVYMLAVKRKE